MNPFDLSGPDFLVLYFVVVAIGLVLAALLRWALRTPTNPPDDMPALDPFEVAYLAGGGVMAVNTAIAQQLQAGSLRLEETTGKLARAGGVPNKDHPLVAAIVGSDVTDIKSVRTAAATEVARIRERLEELGLLVVGGQRFLANALPLLLMLLVVGFGGIKIMVGTQRHKPVGYLVGACFITVVISLAGFARRVHRSRRGDWVLNELKQRHAALQTAAQKHPGGLALPDLSMAVALFGLGIVATGPLAGLHKLLTPPSGGGCGDGGSGCGGGDGGGGGCGGCGGGGGD